MQVKTENKSCPYNDVVVFAQIKDGLDGARHLFGKVFKETCNELSGEFLFVCAALGARYYLEIDVHML